MFIKWTNKLSGEQGFVKNIRLFRGYFENTPEIENAHMFRDMHECNAALKLLREFGEMKQNSFEVI